jgi:DNA-3-methyladenine glycosylase
MASSRADRAPEALPAELYERPVLEVARELIGCRLEHRGVCGVIVETEAYHQSEPACHAYVGLTARTSTLFGPPGRAYVYLSYGVHSLFNVVCEREGIGAAVLIRALAPLRGIELMRARRGGGAAQGELCSGPGKLTQALDIDLALNASDLSGGPIRLLRARREWSERPIVSSTRVGIAKATELPWRLCARGDPNVSKPWPASWSGLR